MAKIRHVAFMTKEPQKLHDFYQKVFDFEPCYASASGARMVIDGRFNLAFLPIREGESDTVGTHRADGGEVDQRPGINHYGFIIDNVDETVRRVGENLQHGQNPQDGRPAEMRVTDPWGNNFDLSSRGFFGREEAKLPGVRQVVIQVDRPDQMAEFYTSKLDLHEVRRADDGSILLSDGDVNFTLVEEGFVGKRGIQYLGIQVEDLAETLRRMRDFGITMPIPKSPAAEVKLRDPDGNLFALSQRGWEV
jgi:catechol 2,3-dioxygenase-like lactoylglutathione lyase family enzyme